MSDHEQQQPDPTRGKILDALARAERAIFTRKIPKSATAQMKFLLTRTKDSTKDLAKRLGTSRRTVERYRAGQLKTPQKKLQQALVRETESEWQPQVRAQARERAATFGGMFVECTAYFGFEANGSSDDGRQRFVSTPISPVYAAEILAAQDRGATEEELHPIVAAAITESYFTDWGTRCDGLKANFTDVLALDIQF